MKVAQRGILVLVTGFVLASGLAAPWHVRGADSPSPVETSDPSCCTLDSNEPDLWLTPVNAPEGTSIDPGWVKVCSVEKWGGCAWFRPLTRDEIDATYPEAFDPCGIWPCEDCDLQEDPGACWQAKNDGIANIDAFNNRRALALHALVPDAPATEWDGKPNAAQILAKCAELNIPERDCREYNKLP